MKLVFPKSDQCSFCDKKSTTMFICFYGLFGDKLFFTELCEYHSKKINKGEYHISGKGKIDFFESD